MQSYARIVIEQQTAEHWMAWFIETLRVATPEIEGRHRDDRQQYFNPVHQRFTEVVQSPSVVRFRMNLSGDPSAKDLVLLFQKFNILHQLAIGPGCD
jgi:hypothetical protein